MVALLNNMTSTLEVRYAKPNTLSHRMQTCYGTHNRAWGGPWNIGINAKRGAGTRLMIETHWTLFRQLWESLGDVANHAIDKGTAVCIDWVWRCAYWRDPKVNNYSKKKGFEFSDFDGCMYQTSYFGHQTSDIRHQTSDIIREL